MKPQPHVPHATRSAAKRRSATGFIKQCSKLVLVTAAYQIFVVGMEPVNAQDQSASMQLAQVPDPGESHCVDHIGGGGGGGGGGCWGCQGYTGPNATEVAAQQRQQEATYYNERGVEFYKQENWKRAVDAFTAALRLTPYDATMQKNLANAKQMLAAEQARQKQESYDRLSTKMRFSGGRNDYDGGGTAPKEVNSGAGGGLGLKDLRMGDRSGEHDKPSPPAHAVAQPPPFADPDARDAVADIPAGTATGATTEQLQRRLDKEAQRQWTAGDLAGAEQTYRKGIANASADPEHAASLRLRLAQVLLAKGDYDGAAMEFSLAAPVTSDTQFLRSVQETIAANPRGAKALAALPTQQKSGAVAPTHVLTPFPQPGNRVPVSVLNTSDAYDKTEDHLAKGAEKKKDIKGLPFKPTHPVITFVPKKLQETAKWQQLEKENATLQEEKKELENKIQKLTTAKSLSKPEQKAEELLEKDLLMVEEKIAKTEAKAQEWIDDPVSWTDRPAPAEPPPLPTIKQETTKP